MEKQSFFLLTISLIFYFLSILIFKVDKNFTFRWLTLFLSFIPVLIVVALWVFSLMSYKKVFLTLNRYYFFIILLLSVITRFIFLVDYPFVSVGDEVRDGGLNAMEISTGVIKNIFGYGRYESHGLIIPTMTSFFYKIFGSSVLVYRFPAAIVSILDVLLLFLLLYLLTKNNIASFLGTMVLIALPLHLFHSRTEIVVILSSLFSTIILLGLFVFFRRKTINIIDYIFLGVLLGFTFNLHASIKAFAIITLATVILISLYQWFSRKLNTNQVGIRLLLLVIFLFVGFGPRLLNTQSLNIFFKTSELPFVNEKQLDIKNIGEKYKKSLLVWVAEPTSFHYRDPKPFFSPLLFSFMILGIIVSFARKNLYLITVFCFTLILHLTNSALTYTINADHRLGPLYPIGPLFVGIGLAFILEKIKLKLLQYILTGAIFIFLSYQTISFFILQPANKNKDVGDYLSMHTIYFLKSNNDLFNKSDNLIFIVSPLNYQKFNYLHYKEQYNFFLPKKNILIEKSENIADNEIYIKDNKSDLFGKRYVIKCRDKSYYCPLGDNKDIFIYY